MRFGFTLTGEAVHICDELGYALCKVDILYRRNQSNRLPICKTCRRIKDAEAN